MTLFIVYAVSSVIFTCLTACIVYYYVNKSMRHRHNALISAIQESSVSKSLLKISKSAERANEIVKNYTEKKEHVLPRVKSTHTPKERLAVKSVPTSSMPQMPRHHKPLQPRSQSSLAHAVVTMVKSGQLIKDMPRAREDKITRTYDNTIEAKSPAAYTPPLEDVFKHKFFGSSLTIGDIRLFNGLSKQLHTLEIIGNSLYVDNIVQQVNVGDLERIKKLIRESRDK